MPETTSDDHGYEYWINKHQIITRMPDLWAYMEKAQVDYKTRGYLDKPLNRRGHPVYPIASILDDINRSFDGDNTVTA